MNLSDFDYQLPSELIAENPVSPRDHSRLLVLNKKTGQTEHKHFYDLVDLLEPGDFLVLNNSKVFPARLHGNKKGTGGKMEVFLHKKIDQQNWQCIIGGRGAKPGLIIEFAEGLSCVIIKNNQDGTFNVEFNQDEKTMMKTVQEIGSVPLPPYIEKKREDMKMLDQEKDDKTTYQTVYAQDKKVGSVAVPTAGLHFTPELIQKLKDKGVQFEYLTLHVGLGTFAPVKVENIKEHKMHAEWVEIESDVIKRIKKAKQSGKRIISVGTTSTRSLEAAVRSESWQKETDFSSWVDIFIYPGFEFKAIDAMLTNFHLPKSTLIMLISALASREIIMQAYYEAIEKKYRFYSYGDSIFIR